MNETRRYNIKDFNEECRKNGLMPPEDIMEKQTQLFLQGIDYIDIPSSLFDEMYKEKTEREHREKLYREITSLRLDGMKQEKAGYIEAAIISYRLCIEKGESVTSMFHAYSYAYERIIILLHKVKDFEGEAEFIKSYLKHDTLSDSQRNNYLNRLNKLVKI